MAEGSCREIQVVGIDGSFKTLIAAKTPRGLSTSVEGNFVTVSDGGKRVAVFNRFFSLKMMDTTQK